MLIAVGGNSRKAGKTSVVAGLIRALPEAGWTAVKITQFDHSVCIATGKTCDCASVDPQRPYLLTEELNPRPDADSGRYLAAGARRAFWVRSAAGQLESAVPALRRLIAGGGNFIFESNSIVEFLKPDLFLAVLDLSAGDRTKSSLRFLECADAVVLTERTGQILGSPNPWWAGKPQFRVRPPDYAPAALAEFVRVRLSEARSAGGNVTTTESVPPGSE